MRNDTFKETSPPIVAAPRITDAVFQNFAVFDTLVLRRWLTTPMVFSSAFLFFSILCVLLRFRTEKALFMAAVMLGIAFVFPAASVIVFLRSVSGKTRELKLGADGKHTCSLTLTDAPDGVSVENIIRPQDSYRLSWDRIFHVFRCRDCIYLYISGRQAILLPNGCANVSDDGLWEFLKKHLAADKLTDRRTKHLFF